MKQKYFIFKTEDGYDWTTNENELNGKEILFESSCNEKFVSMWASKKIGEFKLADGIIEDLPDHFIGKGEVEGFVFDLVYKDDKFYVYKVQNNYYEVFDKVYYGNKVKYPKGEDFGFTAWTYTKDENLIRFVKAKYKVDLTDKL